MAATSRFENLPVLTSQVGVSTCDVCRIGQSTSPTQWDRSKRCSIYLSSHVQVDTPTFDVITDAQLVTANHSQPLVACVMGPLTSSAYLPSLLTAWRVNSLLDLWRAGRGTERPSGE